MPSSSNRLLASLSTDDFNLLGPHLKTVTLGLRKTRKTQQANRRPFIVGRPEEAEAHEKEALRLSPRDSFAWLWLHFAGAAKMARGANEEAVALFRRSIENNRTIPLTHFFLAAGLANLDRLEEAQSEAKAGLALDPGFSIRRFGSGGQAAFAPRIASCSASCGISSPLSPRRTRSGGYSNKLAHPK
jgi:tetratricopeptide (TPR) repeat protein